MTRSDIPGARRPLQARGRRRVGLILDAAADMIGQGGVESLTMHGIAERSGTAIGSLYHFFPNLSAVVDELFARQGQEMRGRLSALEDSAVDWAGLSIGEAVNQFLDPFLQYFESHPEVLLVLQHKRAMGTPPDPQISALFLRLAESVVRARQPGLSKPSQEARAATVVAAIIGGVQFTVKVPQPSRPVMVQELRRLLAAYFDSE